LSDYEKEQSGNTIRYEHGIPILEVHSRLTEVERKAAATEIRDQEHKDRQESINFRMMLFTGLLVATSIISGGVSIWQGTIADRSAKAAESAALTASSALREAQRPTSDSHIAAQAAKDAADTADATLKDSQKTFETNQRPYIVIDGAPRFLSQIEPDVPIRANVTIRNIGKTPANSYQWTVELKEFRPEPKGSPNGVKKLTTFFSSMFFEIEKTNKRSEQEIRQLNSEWGGQDLAPNATAFTTNHDVVLGARDVADLKDGSAKLALFYVGQVIYSDSFKTAYKTDFCWIYWGTDPTTWHICDTHNTIH